MAAVKKRTAAAKASAAADQRGQAQFLDQLEIVHVDINTVVANQYNPNRQSEHDFELLCRSIQEDGFCVEESTPVLCADLVWRPAGSLTVGQELVAFDEEPDPEANYKHGRRFRTATVTANALFEDELYEVRTEQGEVVRCNAKHPWLTRRQNGPMDERFNGQWVETKDLQPNDLVVKLFQPWEVDRSYDAGWLSGFLDGEGCVAAETPNNGSAIPVVRLSVTQKPGETANRMIAEMDKRCPCAVSVTEWSKTHPERNWKDNVRVRVSTMADIMTILGTVRPARLLANAGQFWEGRSIATKNSDRAIASVNKIGRGTLASLSTSTETYIANGFAVHNTRPIVVRKDTLEIVDGEHRWRACKALGHTEIACVIVEMTDAQARIATLKYNRIHGSEDANLAANVLKDIMAMGSADWAQDSLMLDDVEMKRLSEELAAVETDGISVDIPADMLGPSGKGLTDADIAGGVDISADQTRAKQKLLAEAKAGEESAMAAQDSKIYRIVAFYTGEEAQIVKRVLGDNATASVVAICREEHQAAQPAA